jgi:hypothetical protein
MTIKGGGLREEMIEQYKNIGKSDDCKESRLSSLDSHRKAIRDERHEYRRGIIPSLSKADARILCVLPYKFTMEFPYVPELGLMFVHFDARHFIRAVYILLTGLNKMFNRRIEIEYIATNNIEHPDGTTQGIPGYYLYQLQIDIINYIRRNIIPRPFDIEDETIQEHLRHMCNYSQVNPSVIVNSINYLLSHNEHLKMNPLFNSDFNYNMADYLKVRMYNPDDVRLCGVFTNLPADIDVLYPVDPLDPFALKATKNCFIFMYETFQITPPTGKNLI